MKDPINVVKLEQLHNRTISSELAIKIKELIEEASKLLWDAKDMHTASHGDTYHFKDEIPDGTTAALYFGTFPKLGVTRRPNPYEKKAFARDAEVTIGKAQSKLLDVQMIFNKEGFDDVK